MKFRSYFYPLTALLGLLLLCTACVFPPSTPAAPLPTGTPKAAPSATSDTQTTTAVPTIPPTESAATPAVATETPVSVAQPPVITSENAAQLTKQSVTLPEWPERLLWPAAGAQIPGSAAPLYAQSGLSLVPVTLDPLAAGKAIPLNVPGRIIAFAPGMQSFITQVESGPYTLFGLDSKPIFTFPLSAPYAGSYADDGSLVVIGGANEIDAEIFQVAPGTPGGGKALAHLTGFQTAAPVYNVGLVPGGKTVYWISRATLQFQDIASGQLGEALKFTDFIGPYAFSADGKRLLLSVEGKLMLFEAPSAHKIAEVNLSQPVTSLSISAAAPLAATGYGESIQFWNLQDLTPGAELPGPGGTAVQLSFSPDGRYLVSLYDNNLLAIWKAAK